MLELFNSVFNSVAYASDTPAQPTMIENLIPFLMIGVAMYFLMIRPQSKKAKEQAELLKNLKVGDEVVTSAGMIGKIKNLTEDLITLDLGSSQVKMIKSHVLGLYKEKAKA